MHLKTITLDGFKSYGQRTEVRGFDPEFNAITGLNGSGKSNILDAICFVLGITNLSHVRAGSMQELVYKNGQAGVTKASVTITFDNRDPVGCPVGYESHNEITVTRQVVIGGKNKYLLNGTSVQNRRIQDLFCSVQMNVNNPHFLIMQGRITKVLNMKPPEILSMIEEAAGTRMYEAKRQSAQKTIEKKDAKLTQLNDLVDDEIRPKLNKLREEKGQYLEYQKVIRELETNTRLFVAYQYVTLQETSEMTNGTLKRVKANIQTSRKCIEDNRKELKSIEVCVADLHKKRDEETGGVLEALEVNLKAMEKAEAQSVSALKAMNENVTSEMKKKKQLESSLKDDEKAFKVKEAEHAKVQGMFQELKDTDKADAEALAAAQSKYQAVSSGLLANDDGAQETLQGQLMKVREQTAQALADMKQAQMQLKHSQAELKTKEKEIKTTSTDFQKDEANLHRLEKEVKNLQAQMNKLTYKEGSLEQLQAERDCLASEVRPLREKADRLEAQYSQLNFRYSDPTPNFNRDSVKGLVCNLFKVKDPAMSVALGTVAGGRLYNVIVDNESVGKMILQKGQLKQRVNIIPLNKISAKGLDAYKIKAAQNLVGKENVHSALSLIEYAPEVHNAMVFVFGQAFVCRDMSAASKVAFDKNIRTRCITLEGDVTDPGGTLSGGAAVKGQPILHIVQELNDIQEAVKQKTKAMANADKKIKALSADAAQFGRLRETFDLQHHELEMLRARLQQTEHHQQLEEVEALRTQIVELEKKLTECKKISVDGEKRAKDLEKKMLNAKEIQERELKEAEQETARLKKKAASSRAKWLQREQEYEALKLEISELQASIESGRTQIVAAEKALDDLKVQVSEQQTKVDEAKADVKTVHDELKEKKEIINQKNKEINSLNHRSEKLTKSLGDLELEIKKGEIESAKMESDYKDALSKIDRLTDRYSWVETDKKFFGQQGIYNFKDHDMPSLGQRLGELGDKKEKLSRTVNTRAMNMLEQQEEECGDLISKKQIVENDKSKILKVIKELDEKKKIALRTACKQVNKDFGSIFSSLLPGACARLQPPDGKDVLDGLEVKVGFSGVWKDSLSELSGGQRSLVALSLILAMLMFKPAPIYILDEVDAALDLSHTQNIGNMLKSHFHNSQFIIVSLKDGMFNNANVLFRTAFVDGMSTVSRSVQRQ